jgi:xanthine dehydrogenase large subunit
MDLMDACLHVTGSAQFVDDQPQPYGMLFAAVLTSPVAHGRIKAIDISRGRLAPGVIAVLLAQHIPGRHFFGTIQQDESVLAEEKVEYMGEPLALVVAESQHQAQQACHKIKVDIEPMPVVTDPRQAFASGHIIGTPRTFLLGDVESAWPHCDVIVQGRCDIGGQEHVYLETQRCRAIPLEGGRLRLYSSTQAPAVVQRAVASVLGMQQHDVEVDVRRLGGGFGGKEDQATLWACLAGLAAHQTGRPVEIVLTRSEDLRLTGKRHPYSADFKMGLNKDGVILAYEVSFYQNAGCTTDLSPAILERTLFHCTNAYHIPNVRAFAVSCRTNLPSNTAFRGFGGPQAMFVMEAAIAKAAETMGLSCHSIQRKNLVQNGDVFPYGQIADKIHLRECWEKAETDYGWNHWRKQVDDFNQTSTLFKKGLAVMPVCFGISFTNTMLNQSSALVHVYLDAGVAITIGGVEMGQGLNTKVTTIAARALGINPDRIRIENSNTSRVANSSPTAASASTDLYGYAVVQAIHQIQDRLKSFLSDKHPGVKKEDISFRDEQVLFSGAQSEWTWEKLVQAVYADRIGLSAYGFYASPKIFFDKVREKGHPFLYHVCGVGMIEVTVDGLRGVYTIDRIKIIHDLNESLNERIDRGQVEGGLAQGLGWMTLEDVVYNEKGRLVSDSLSTYKVPDVFFMPDDLEIRFTNFGDQPVGPFRSKAVGEPPLMYGIGVFFALRQAMAAFRPRTSFPFETPLTPERVLMQLYQAGLD